MSRKRDRNLISKLHFSLLVYKLLSTSKTFPSIRRTEITIKTNVNSYSYLQQRRRTRHLCPPNPQQYHIGCDFTTNINIETMAKIVTMLERQIVKFYQVQSLPFNRFTLEFCWCSSSRPFGSSSALVTICRSE